MLFEVGMGSTSPGNDLCTIHPDRQTPVFPNGIQAPDLMGKCDIVTSADWTHLQKEVRNMELSSMCPQSSEETCGANDSPVNADYLARYGRNGELLATRVKTDATSAFSKSTHLVGSSPLFL